MLIRFREKEPVFSFAQLYWQTTLLLAPIRRERKTAVVLGPITGEDQVIVRKNLIALNKRARELSRAGLYVLDITSYHPITKRIIAERGSAEYPHDLLEEFTLPLIKNGWFNVINFRQPFVESVGTLKEYEAAQQAKRLYDIHIVGFY